MVTTSTNGYKVSEGGQGGSSHTCGNHVICSRLNPQANVATEARVAITPTLGVSRPATIYMYDKQDARRFGGGEDEKGRFRVGTDFGHLSRRH